MSFFILYCSFAGEGFAVGWAACFPRRPPQQLQPSWRPGLLLPGVPSCSRSGVPQPRGLVSASTTCPCGVFAPRQPFLLGMVLPCLLASPKMASVGFSSYSFGRLPGTWSGDADLTPPSSNPESKLRVWYFIPGNTKEKVCVVW